MSHNTFDRMAKRYDNEQRVELASVIATEIRKHLSNDINKTLLDYGCGTGLVGLQFTDKFKRIVFTDISEEMLKVVDSKIELNQIQNAETKQVDSLHNVKPDTIIISLVMLHVPEYKQLIKDLYEILNDAGKLIIVDFNKNEEIQHDKVHNGFTQTEMETALSSAGFNTIGMTTFYHGKNIFMNKDASMFIATAKK